MQLPFVLRTYMFHIAQFHGFQSYAEDKSAHTVPHSCRREIHMLCILKNAIPNNIHIVMTFSVHIVYKTIYTTTRV